MTYWSSKEITRASTREGTTAALGIWIPTGELVKQVDIFKVIGANVLTFELQIQKEKKIESDRN